MLKYAHEDLEVCVGIATAAFVAATLRGDVSACDRMPPPPHRWRRVDCNGRPSLEKNYFLLVACSAFFLCGACDVDAVTAEQHKLYYYR